MSKRSRACEECHRLKIKCDVSISSDGTCDRCRRNRLECVPTAPRLQRDRINALEAQVQELRKALRAKSNSSSDNTSGRTPSSSSDSHSDAILSFLDARIPLSKQQDLLLLFGNQAATAWPILRLPVKLDTLRVKSSVLLLSTLAFGLTQEAQGTDPDVHDELVRETMRILGDEVMSKGHRSLELVQALLIAAFWDKSTRWGQHGSCYQLVQLAADMAIDLGIAGPSLQPSPVSYFSRHDDPTSIEARRTWLACFVALSTSSISMRRPSPVPWDAHHQECLLHLEGGGDPSDLLLCQIVGAIRLIQSISNELSLCHTLTFLDGNDYGTHAMIEALKKRVDAWVTQIPPSLASSQTLKVWQHVAMVYIHEVVLHTPTNKASFAAPFIPGRIAVQDFPTPANIIPPVKPALEALVLHCHAVIDTAAEMEPPLLLSLPPFSFAPTVVYSLFVLVTAMVAATDPTNTYGQCMTKDSFGIEECGLKLRRMAAQLKALDPTLSCYTTRLFDATGWLDDWHNDYVAILRRYEMKLAD